MRKVHYRVTLDVLVYEDEENPQLKNLQMSDFAINPDEDGYHTIRDAEVIDVGVVDVEITDSR